ncbi:hypothetical protein AACH06_23015 [Ideonella sp. DXS29W]|uniref:DUF1618 domain-containing protein n=1 Tax=Ideonella lacteola TaxID=2984193 RepID=A0ABU9BZ35_9BURK
MLRRLLSKLRRSAGPSQAPVQTDVPVKVSSTEEPSPPWSSVVLVRQEDPANRFGLEGYECEAFATSMTSTTGDPQIAAHFATSRTARNESIAGTLPEGAVEHPCDLSYPCPGGVADGPLRKAEVMEDKWDIYLYGQRIYFCRSWTGRLVFVVDFSLDGARLHFHRIWSQAGIDAPMPVRQVDYLIKSHLERRRAPHPLPSSLAREPGAIAMYSFSEYGRICCFGSYEDTTTIP